MFNVPQARTIRDKLQDVNLVWLKKAFSRQQKYQKAQIGEDLTV